MEYVLLGNDVIFKCKIPSFVDDLVNIINWVDNDGNMIYPKINKGKEKRQYGIGLLCEQTEITS